MPTLLAKRRFSHLISFDGQLTINLSIHFDVCALGFPLSRIDVSGASSLMPINSAVPWIKEFAGQTTLVSHTHLLRRTEGLTLNRKKRQSDTV